MNKISSLSHIIALACLFNFSTTVIAETTPRKAHIKIIAFGDSLTAGYGLPREAAFPVRLEKKLKKQGHNIRVVNAGISGDTATGGLARLAWAVPKDADAVILELGANDALRGVSPAKTRKSLEKIIVKLKKKNIEILIAGMIAPEGMGNKFSSDFNSIYADLAKKYDALYYPFFLDGVALDPKLNQSDGIHPNSTGVNIIVDNITPSVLKLIKRARSKTPGKKQTVTTN